MPSTATTRNRFEKQGTGENTNAWGTKLNTTGLDLIDSALDGMAGYTLSGTKTLSSTNYVADESRMRFQKITGGTGGTVTIPSLEKWYVVRNGASGAVVFTTGGGATASIAAGITTFIVCDGTNVYTLSLDEAVTAAEAAQAAAEVAQAAAELAETNAETAETNAETAETNAETAQAAAEAAQAAAEAARDEAVGSVLPDQTGNSGKVLTTNGTAASWGSAGWQQIAQTTTGAVSSWGFTSISQAYKDLLFAIQYTGSNNPHNFEVTLDYGSGFGSADTMVANLTNTAYAGAVLIPGYTYNGGIVIGGLTSSSNIDFNATTTGVVGAWKGAGIEGVRFSLSAGTGSSVTITLYGR